MMASLGSHRQEEGAEGSHKVGDGIQPEAGRGADLGSGQATQTGPEGPCQGPGRGV
jgi:hypothetical protein